MKASDSIVMIGAPESGKTNYLGRLWQSLRVGNTSLRATQQSDDIRYVVEALGHLLQGKFAPRTEKNAEIGTRHCLVPVAWEREGKTQHAELLVPDVSGELWKEAVETNELPEAWMVSLRRSVGALLFVRVQSTLNRPSLDWVTAGELLEIERRVDDARPEEVQIPTDIQLCEFLRLLEFALGKDAAGGRPRVAVLVAAWDLVDKGRAERGPKAYLHDEFPLFAGRLANVSTLEVEVFGVSVVGGDFIDDAFTGQFLKGDIDEFGYVVTESGTMLDGGHMTAPVRWVLDGNVGR